MFKEFPIYDTEEVQVVLHIRQSYGTHCNYIMKDDHINLLRGAISNKHTYFVDGRTKTKYLTNCHNNLRKST